MNTKFLFYIFMPAFILMLSFNNCSKVDLVKDDLLIEEMEPYPPQFVEAALAVRGSTCLACHIKVTGNFYTDFGYPNKSFFNHGLLSKDTFCTRHSTAVSSYRGTEDHTGTHGSRYSISSMGWNSPVQMNHGFFIVPRENLLNQWDGTRFEENVSLKSIKDELWTRLSKSPLVTSASDDKKNKDQFIKEVSSMYIGAPGLSDLTLLTNRPDARLLYSNLGRSSIKVYAIGKTSNMSGLSFLSNEQDHGYLANIKILSGQNGEIQPLNCTGDIVVLGGPIVLLGNDSNNQSLVTSSAGCRIYSENTIFIQDDFKIKQSEGEQQNLQLSSSRAVIMGLGYNRLYSRLFEDEAGLRGGESCSSEESSSSSLIINDFQIVKSHLSDAGPQRICHINIDPLKNCIKTNQSNECLNGNFFLGEFDNSKIKVLNANSPDYKDNNQLPEIINQGGPSIECEWISSYAATFYYPNEPTRSQGYNAFFSSRKKIEFEHMVINAPQIHSRYLGKFKGLVIGEYALFAVGNFEFEHDSETLSKTRIFPLLLPKIFTFKE